MREVLDAVYTYPFTALYVTVLLVVVIAMAAGAVAVARK